MESVIMITGLGVMSVSDIKRKAVPVYMIIVTGLMALAIKVTRYLKWRDELDIYEMMIISAVTVIFAIISVLSHVMGIADALVMGIVAIVTGIRRAVSVFFIAMLLVCAVSGILLVLKKIKRKDTIPFIPFIFASYVGVIICG